MQISSLEIEVTFRLLVLLTRKGLKHEEVVKILKHHWRYGWGDVKASFPRQYRRGFRIPEELSKGRLWAAADCIQNVIEDDSGYAMELMTVFVEAGYAKAFLAGGRKAMKASFVRLCLRYVAEAIDRGDDPETVSAHLKTMGWDFSWNQYWRKFWFHSYLFPDVSREMGLERTRLWAGAGLLMDLTNEPDGETLRLVAGYIEAGLLDRFL